jgi:integrase/recombinase XerD
MPNREVNLTKRIQTDKGSRYCPIVLAANGRAKPDYVLVDGKEERHVEGAYYIEWRENGRRRRLSVGKNAGEAMAQRLRKEAELNARNHGVGIALTSTHGKRSLAGAVAEYLEEIKLSKKPKTYAAYITALAYFQESCAKTNLEEIERKDLLKYAAFLRDEKEKTSPRAVWQTNLRT